MKNKTESSDTLKIEEKKKLGFNLIQRKYILRIEQYYLEKENQHLKHIIELQKKVNELEIYREQTDKLRKYVFDNNIGMPNQIIFEAAIDEIENLKNQIKEITAARAISEDALLELNRKIKENTIDTITAWAEEQEDFFDDKFPYQQMKQFLQSIK